MRGSLHIHNARIWTGDAARPWANAIRIEDGRITQLDAVSGASTAVPVIDARGRTIVPGLIDSHVHLLMGGRSLSDLDLSGVRSRAEFEQAIASAHAQLPPGGGRWLIGRGWSQENWPDRAMPDKSWLATCSAVSVRPCVCYRMDMHAAVVNEPVLEMCAVQNCADPVGGTIVREAESGEPTGLLLEAALWQMVNPIVPVPDAAMMRMHLIAAQNHAHAMGLTAVGSMEYARDVDDVYRPMRDELTLRCRITLLDRDWGGRPMSFEYGREFDSNESLAVIGYKAFIDGTLGSRTARMLSDYADDPGNRGMLVELAAAGHLCDWARAVAQSDISPSMHAIGDEAVRLALNAIDAIDPDMARRVPPRIEHAQQIDPGDLPRFKGRIVSMQPLHKADDGRYLERRLGKERMHGSFAFRRLLDAGALLAFGSDWPVVSCDPIRGMRAAITGLTLEDKPLCVDQNLSVEETLRAYTSGAAHCLRMHDAGILREGMLGDLVMFDVDPFSADWARKPPRVIMTVVGGEIVFDETQN